MNYCTACGAELGATRFCTHCGRDSSISYAAHPAAAASVAAPPPGGPWDAAARIDGGLGELGDRVRRLPREMQVVCGAMAVAGLLLAGVTLLGMDPALQLLTSGSIFWVLGLLVLSGMIVVAAAAAALLVLAYRMTRGDRVARGLSYILLGAVLVTVVAVGDTGLVEGVVILGCAAALGVLALAPNVNAFFLSHPHRGDEPVPVVVARTLLAAWAALILLTGLVFLPLGRLDGKVGLIGLVLICLAAGAFTLNGRLGSGDSGARVLASIAAGIYAILLLASDQWQAANVLPIALAGGVVAFLWLPAESKDHFGS